MAAGVKVTVAAIDDGDVSSELSLAYPLGVNEDVNASFYTYYIKEAYLVVVIMGIGIDDACEQVGDVDFLDVIHSLHNVDGNQTVE